MATAASRAAAEEEAIIKTRFQSLVAVSKGKTPMHRLAQKCVQSSKQLAAAAAGRLPSSRC
jgi:hypothetical protein